MKNYFFTKVYIFAISFLLVQNLLFAEKKSSNSTKFFNIDNQNLIGPSGNHFEIKGINLGNWLNPEGYMFLFENASSYRLIDQAFKEMIGTDRTNIFWHQFQDQYITQSDIHYIRKTGMNSIRIPFHYKLFTNEDYMGYNNSNRGFELLDRVVKWCKSEGLYVILDMHDAPGGQTGDNIDDSYGYPWLFENGNDQLMFCSIWGRIAKHYANETTIIGYDLLNEPIAPYFNNKDEINKKLENVYKMAVASIRKYDKNHIVLLGGAQWDGNFAVFTDWHFDNKMMYTCHRYWCDTLQANIQDLLDFRNKVNLPIYMGETGENTDNWVSSFRKLLEKNNIGWHYWPYKKLSSTRGMVSIKVPEKWNLLTEYINKERNGFDKIRALRPSQSEVQKALDQFIENMKFKNCTPNANYIKALGMNP
ncbi:MAG: cellulase family glycosylhydrolase [Paludibacter sp.]|nr:cellulase family glycosylhydrolase [Paludibacter sp.]